MGQDRQGNINYKFNYIKKQMISRQNCGKVKT